MGALRTPPFTLALPVEGGQGRHYRRHLPTPAARVRSPAMAPVPADGGGAAKLR